MDELISLENLIKEAKSKGIDFGKGDPYNRLRYYTKIGWLPHMVRKKDNKGGTKGHYPISAIDKLVLIEQLKERGVTNDEISKELKVKTKFQSILDVVKSKETRGQVITYVSLALLVLILAVEVDIIRIGQPKTAAKALNAEGSFTDGPKQLIESGTAFIPKNQRKLFVQTNSIKKDSKVYVTFTNEYSPATRFWVSEIQDYAGFTIELDTPVFDNSEFNWWITN